MTLHDVCAWQQAMVGAYVRNVMVFATLPMLVAQAMYRDRAGPDSIVVSIASHSFETLRNPEDRTGTGTVLSFSTFATRVKRKMLGMTASSPEILPPGADNE